MTASLDALCALTGRARRTVPSTGTSAVEEHELAELVKANGARLLDPNCMGVVDTTSELRLSWGEFPAGGVGLVSQSGNLALEIGRLLALAGQGFSHFVSLGNQRDCPRCADGVQDRLCRVRRWQESG
ncbi:hypothetical protein OG729_05245 [Streptomyces sp. NBC_00210]|uniref:hypothetical protein n=1 Tax=Streptomyces sp. NBC_00210 TaxID=2903636 RepID=UPI0032484BBA